jgi:hypothetical protein
MIPFLWKQKMKGRAGDFWNEGWKAKKYDDIRPFLEVKIISCDSSK